MHNSLEQLTAYGNAELQPTETQSYTHLSTQTQPQPDGTALLWWQVLALLREELPRQDTNTAKRSGVTRERSPTVSMSAGCRQAVTALRAGTLSDQRAERGTWAQRGLLALTHRITTTDTGVSCSLPSTSHPLCLLSLSAGLSALQNHLPLP